MRTTADVAFAARFLEQRFGSESSAPTELAGGAWSRAYAYERAGAQWVIRFSPYRDDLAKDRLAARYRSPALPIPEVVDMGKLDDLWYAIAPFVEGRFLEELDAVSFTRALPAVLDMIDAMRVADTSAFGGFGAWEPDGQGGFESWRSYLLHVAIDDPRYRTYGWRRTLSANPAAERVFEDAVAALASVVDACPERRNLVHNDLLHANVFVDPGGRVSGVIDWANSLYGDCLYDVALIAFWAPWYPAIDEDALLEQARARLDPSEQKVDERVTAYQLRIGAEHVAYNAYLGQENSDEMERVCRRTAEIASRLDAGGA